MKTKIFKNKKFKKIIESLVIILFYSIVTVAYNSRIDYKVKNPAVQNNSEIPKNISQEIKNFGQIDKINLLAPVIKNVDGTNKEIYNKELQKGVAHYKGTALPGEGSNIFIFGHSSTNTGKGNYAIIFGHLNDLEWGVIKLSFIFRKKNIIIKFLRKNC